MDNLSSHKRASVREMIEAAGARLLFLPPYSPDFNPIEMAFAKLKALLRKAAARTLDGLWNAIGRFVDCFIPTLTDQNPCAQLRRRMDRMRQGWSMRSFQAEQQ